MKKYKKNQRCVRCEVLDKHPIKEGTIKYVTFNGIEGYVCKECFIELQEEDTIYEIEKNEGPD